MRKIQIKALVQLLGLLAHPARHLNFLVRS